MSSRPKITAIAAMSADGKIADVAGSPARFASAADKAHLETQIAAVDAVIFGANTLRAYGTSLPISNPKLLQQRQANNQPPQPIHIVCSRSGKFALDLPFFNQSIPRWLLTTIQSSQQWQKSNQFTQILQLDTSGNLATMLAELFSKGIEKLAILGGSELFASFAEQGFIDELWLTFCPILLGGKTSPTLMGGQGLFEAQGLRLDLIESKIIESEIFVHYRMAR
ncbi:MAG: RibD family protein [Limnothrix sp.]